VEVRFSSDATREVSNAARYYERAAEGLGKAFLQKIKESVSEIKLFPFASRIIRGDYRRRLVSRFPYGIIYRISKDTIFVAAVMHLKQKPDYWINR